MNKNNFNIYNFMQHNNDIYNIIDDDRYTKGQATYLHLLNEYEETVENKLLRMLNGYDIPNSIKVLNEGVFLIIIIADLDLLKKMTVNFNKRYIQLATQEALLGHLESIQYRNEYLFLSWFNIYFSKIIQTSSLDDITFSLKEIQSDYNVPFDLSFFKISLADMFEHGYCFTGYLQLDFKLTLIPEGLEIGI